MSGVAAVPGGSGLSRGEWLRAQRQARGSVPEMRRHLREAARQAGDTLPGNECLAVMIRRWEKDDSGVSERYQMHYCRAFGLPLTGFGTAPLPAGNPGTQDRIVTTVPAELPVGEDERAELARLRSQYAELYVRHRKLKRELYAWITRVMNEDHTWAREWCSSSAASPPCTPSSRTCGRVRPARPAAPCRGGGLQPGDRRWLRAGVGSVRAWQASRARAGVISWQEQAWELHDGPSDPAAWLDAAYDPRWTLVTQIGATHADHADGSWARATGSNGEPAQVHQSGPRRLWDLVDEYRSYWLTHGCLPLRGATARIDPDGTCHLTQGKWHATIPSQTGPDR